MREGDVVGGRAPGKNNIICCINSGLKNRLLSRQIGGQRSIRLLKPKIASPKRLRIQTMLGGPIDLPDEDPKHQQAKSEGHCDEKQHVTD